mgnify:CR=1 FL=1
MYRRELLTIISYYGEQYQIDKAIEEMSELTQALIKARQDPDNLTEENVLEEVADVWVMIEQLKLIFKGQEVVEEYVDYKVSRQMQRIMNESRQRRKLLKKS